jgi:hypothetical protein
LNKLGMGERTPFSNSPKAISDLNMKDRSGLAAQSGENLLSAAQSLEGEQLAILESVPVEQVYQKALAEYVEAKHLQVERIEDRLEKLIDRQQARLQQSQANMPGFLSLPGTKRAWQIRQEQQQGRLQCLYSRLESVREIKEGIGLHSPKIEELAVRKLRGEQPELAEEWDDMQEAGRKHQLLMRQKDKERSQGRERNRSLVQSLSMQPNN